MDLVDDSIELSPEAQQIIGLQAAGRIALGDLLERIASAGDREGFLAGLNRARTGLREFQVRFRVKTREGLRLLHAQGKTIYNFGEPVIVGVMQELTGSFQPGA